MAERELRYEMSRLNVGSLVDVSPGATVRPDVLRDLVKLTAPAVRRRCDRLREAMKTYTRDHGAARDLALRARQAYEKAEDWICAVDDRCRAEQLHVEAKRLPKTVDFEPFKPGSTVSVYEFLGKFEAWSTGALSLDSKAHLLYSKYLDGSITRGNRELELCKQNYQQIKAWLIAEYGNLSLIHI